MNRFIASLFLLLGIAQLSAQQVGDEQFHYPITDPHHRIGDGPLLLFDEAHNFIGSTNERYIKSEKEKHPI